MSQGFSLPPFHDNCRRLAALSVFLLGSIAPVCRFGQDHLAEPQPALIEHDLSRVSKSLLFSLVLGLNGPRKAFIDIQASCNMHRVFVDDRRLEMPSCPWRFLSHVSLGLLPLSKTLLPITSCCARPSALFVGADETVHITMQARVLCV